MSILFSAARLGNFLWISINHTLHVMPTVKIIGFAPKSAARRSSPFCRFIDWWLMMLFTNISVGMTLNGLCSYCKSYSIAKRDGKWNLGVVRVVRMCVFSYLHKVLSRGESTRLRSERVVWEYCITNYISFNALTLHSIGMYGVSGSGIVLHTAQTSACKIEARLIKTVFFFFDEEENGHICETLMSM